MGWAERSLGQITRAGMNDGQCPLRRRQRPIVVTLGWPSLTRRVSTWACQLASVIVAASQHTANPLWFSAYVERRGFASHGGLMELTVGNQSSTKRTHETAA